LIGLRERDITPPPVENLETHFLWGWRREKGVAFLRDKCENEGSFLARA